MADTFIPMSTWTPKDGQTYEIVDAEARERITELEEHGGTGTVKSVNNVEPDASGNVTLSIPEAVTFMTASEIDAMWGSIDGLPDGDEVSY